MRVLIDDHPLDVTLETEETLSQLFSGVNSFLLGHGLVITGLEIDSDQLDLDQLSVWGDRPIENIEEIRVQTLPQWQLTLSHLDLVHAFVSRWREAVTSGNRDAVRSLASEQSDLAGHLEEHVGLIFADLRGSAFPRMFEIAGDPLAMGDKIDDPARLLREMDSLIALIDQRIAEIEQPARVAATTAGLVTGMIPQLQDISVMLQTARDQEAMATLVRFTEVLEKLLRTLPHLARTHREFGDIYHGDATMVTASSELNERLHELLAAFDSQDTVLIGDLLEYEIVPRIEKLLTVIPVDGSE